MHFNKARGNTINEALSTNMPDALAVLGIKYEIDARNKSNKDLEIFFNTIDQIQKEGSKAEVKDKIRLKNFLPRATGRFFRYNGSLTNPPCNEAVVWTVFKDYESISRDQINKLRELRKVQGRPNQLEDNIRPVQPLNGRKVLDIDTRQYHEDIFYKCRKTPDFDSNGTPNKSESTVTPRQTAPDRIFTETSPSSTSSEHKKTQIATRTSNKAQTETVLNNESLFSCLILCCYIVFK